VPLFFESAKIRNYHYLTKNQYDLNVKNLLKEVELKASCSRQFFWQVHFLAKFFFTGTVSFLSAQPLPFQRCFTLFIAASLFSTLLHSFHRCFTLVSAIIPWKS
jgi:hypothetical protein